ncbi:DUF72 domain-containing protein [Sphingomonas quercus]|uniref:DUF72 domain-containing protein n=1 Tax=Sphingomonas quercus TaxID=2842451 RepID=A0ABS6BLV1_9SPHN|nr:DUF72 domain-containing protein [Sphingomonas quercus]
MSAVRGPVVGTAGWSIARKEAGAFPAEGPALARYARVFRGVEVNSSFYRPHRPATWARWADSVPDGFRFAVKVPRAITHEAKLVDAEAPAVQFASEVGAMGGKLAIMLVQLPPKLAFEPATVERFFTMLRGLTDADIVCEPRNATWFTPEADQLLTRLGIARAAADPALAAAAAVPGGWPGLAYWRLHGSPVMYRSSYHASAIADYARRLRVAAADTQQAWCIFDNTAGSAAIGNALALMAEINALSNSGAGNQ